MKKSSMESSDKGKRTDNTPEKNEKSPIERIETPFPAQEVFPLEQARNDGKQKNDMERIEEDFEQDDKQ